MSWSEYVSRLIGGSSNVDAGTKLGTTGQTVGRWKAGTSLASPDQAVALARAYGDSPLNALVALGHITAAEARQRPAAQPSLEGITDDQLIELVAARIRRGGGERADSSTTTTTPASGPGLSVVNDNVDDLIAADHQEQSISGEQEMPQEP